MAVTRKIPCPWHPSIENVEALIDVDPSDRAMLLAAMEETSARISPFALIREVTVRAVGKGFALLENEWIESPELERHMLEAGKVWAFAVSAGPEIHPSSPFLETLAVVAAHDAYRRLIDMHTQSEKKRITTIPLELCGPICRLLGIECANAFSIAGLLTDASAESCGMAPQATNAPRCQCPHCHGAQCNKHER